MADKSTQTRQHILDELESIRDWLGDDNDDTQRRAFVAKKEKQSDSDRETLAPNALPGQQSLFDSAKSAHQKNSDNPFLPRHIRKRLEHESRETLSGLNGLEKKLRRKHQSTVEKLQLNETQRQDIQKADIDVSHIEDIIQQHTLEFEKSLRAYLLELTSSPDLKKESGQ